MGLTLDCPFIVRGGAWLAMPVGMGASGESETPCFAPSPTPQGRALKAVL